MLKIIVVKLDLAQKYGRATNKYMKLFDKDNRSKHKINCNVNNLQRLAMTEKLPTGGFKWLI